MFPATIRPYEVVDAAVRAEVIHVLCILSRKHIPRGGCLCRRGSVSRVAQIMMVPTVITPPKFMNMAIGTDVVYMWRVLAVEGVSSGRQLNRERSAGSHC